MGDEHKTGEGPSSSRPAARTRGSVVAFYMPVAQCNALYRVAGQERKTVSRVVRELVAARLERPRSASK